MKENVLVLVRAIPEKSRKYGHNVCVAGINDDGSWRRLYPFQFEYGKKLNFRKRDIIEVTIEEPDNDKRKESRKVTGYKTIKSLDEKEVLKRILPCVASVEKLKKEKASLGAVKPELEDMEICVNDTRLYDDQTYLSAAEGFLEKREKVKMPVELRYKFKCKGEKDCSGHRMILIDWELNELTRNIMRNEKDKIIIEQKIREKFFNFMKKRDLYFILGTHFKFGTWMIIGLFYPKKDVAAQKSLVELF